MHLSRGILSHGRCILRYEKVELDSKAGTKSCYSQACTTANGASHYFSHKLRSCFSGIFISVLTGVKLGTRNLKFQLSFSGIKTCRKFTLKFVFRLSVLG